MIGYTLAELSPVSIKTWEQLTHPDDLAVSDRVLKKYFDGESDYYECEARMKHKRGDWIWVSDRGRVVEWTNDGKPLRMSGAHIDITEKKQAELRTVNLLRMREALIKCHAAILARTTERDVFQAICDILVEKRKYDLVWVAHPNLDEKRTVSALAIAGEHSSYVSGLEVHWGNDELGSGPTGLALRTGQSQIVADISEAEIYRPWRTMANKHLFRTSASIPIKSNTQTIGALNVYSSVENRFDAEEISLLEEFAVNLGLTVWTRRVEAERDQITHALKNSSTNIITAVAATIEKRDPYTAGHQLRVAGLSTKIAGKLGWDNSRIEGLRLGAIIHDIGKIYVPSEILNRPGRLTASEVAIMRTHPEVGAEILSGIKFPWPIQEMILQHHERLNGTGYPRGLRGDEIIPEAQVLAVADVVEAITSHRPYRPALGVELAIKEIQEQRGIAYSPEIVDACLAVLKESDVLELNSAAR